MFGRYALISRTALMTLVLVFTPLLARGQSPDSPALEVLKRVAFDPTTYVPAIVSAEAHHLDWKSSQVFFQHGFFESNPDFTLSGLVDTLPVSNGAGNQKIVRGTFATFGISVVNNVAMAFTERALIEWYPAHRKLVRGLGWVGRIAFASWLTYRESAVHFRQWQKNKALAQQLGY